LPGLLLKIAAFFVILEPIWMLLPFAGFLYGSVLHLETLNRNPYTARLAHFVFPTHSLFPLGLILIVAGLLLFLAAAGQVYAGKIRKKGLIRTGLYRRFRHPQYLALAIFGLGIILTWGRMITFIAFFVMLWLYYFLARREEALCRARFGRAYDEYRAASWFLCPGDERFLVAARRLCPKNLPAGVGVALSFLLVIGLAIGSALSIMRIREASRQSLPAISGAYRLPGRQPDRLPLLLIKGPAMQAAPSEQVRDRFMARTFELLHSSARLAAAIRTLPPADDQTLLVFPLPGRNWYDSHLDFRRAEINLFIFCVESPVVYRGDNFQEFRRHWQITRVLRATDLSYGRLAAGLDPVAGKIDTEPFGERMAERIDFFLSGL
jgi:protein-S-isoprenylcysteine O-methyltransferase Ste14